MKHPVNSRTRLKGGMSRFFTRMFRGGDPRGWGDYHIVPVSGGTMWVHTHGLDNYDLPNLEFEGVPVELRGAAVELMLTLVRHARTEQHMEVDGDFSGAFSSDDQRFLQHGTLRDTNHGDAGHRGLLRVVDRGEPMGAGFPARLFASHIAGRAEGVSSAKRRESMFRWAVRIFPGEPAPLDMRVDEINDGPDMTDLQQTSNLGARIGLADVLLERHKRDEALGVLEQTIAYCPGWARQQQQEVASGATDFNAGFWAAADIDEICARLRPDSANAPTRFAGSGGGAQGFGRRTG